MQRQIGNTTYHVIFLMTDTADHITGKTGLSPTVTISKNGGAYGAAIGAVTEIANGVYKLAANATDFNALGAMAIHATATGADPADVLLEVVTHDPFSIPSEVWGYATSRTLTMSATEITNAVSGSSITQIRGNSWSIPITGLTLYATKQQFTIKRAKTDSDADALLFIDSTTGLIRVNGSTTGITATDASIVYAGTTLTVTVKANVTAQLESYPWVYGIQSIHSDGTVSEVYGGTFTITSDAVRATV